jgi:hypothetical protein
METAAKFMIISGVALAAAGVAFLIGARLGLGRLPGDIVARGDNVTIIIPIATSIIISLVLTIVLNIAIRVWR